jgi:hypothetical protein
MLTKVCAHAAYGDPHDAVMVVTPQLEVTRHQEAPGAAKTLLSLFGTKCWR